VHDYLFEEFTRHGRDYDKLTFSVSPKLPCSGERWENAINPKVVKSYEMVGMTYLKFVVATEQDVADADAAVELYRKAGFVPRTAFAPYQPDPLSVFMEKRL
jgi:hypothetical protein